MRYTLILIGALLVVGSLHAQVTFGLNLNIGNQPAWGPTGYDHVEYYYMPDIEAYYNVPTRTYYYNEGGRWIGRSHLPPRFHNYDYYNSYKVVINEREPYRNHDKYRTQYAEYRGRHGQEVIRDSHDRKYFVNKNHPEHNNWVREQRHDNGRGNDTHPGNNGKGNGNGNRGHGNGGKKHD